MKLQYSNMGRIYEESIVIAISVDIDLPIIISEIYILKLRVDKNMTPKF